MARAAATSATPPPFEGFGPKALDFFRALGFHQDKGWYEENRNLHESDVKAPFARLLAELTDRFAAVELPLIGNDRSVFRLHRDVRFAKDKRPYKTNAGAVLTRDGSKRSPGLLYVHLDPEGCFAAAGFYLPEPDQLAALRGRVVEKPAAFRSLVRHLDEAGLALADGDPLSRLPKGFEEVTAADLAGAVRKRSFIVRREIPPARIVEPGMVDDVVAFAQAAAPLLRFGWDAVDAMRAPPAAIATQTRRR